MKRVCTTARTQLVESKLLTQGANSLPTLARLFLTALCRPLQVISGRATGYLILFESCLTCGIARPDPLIPKSNPRARSRPVAILKLSSKSAFGPIRDSASVIQHVGGTLSPITFTRSRGHGNSRPLMCRPSPIPHLSKGRFACLGIAHGT